MNKFSFSIYLILLILISKSLLSQSDNNLQRSMENFEYYSFRSLDSCINIQKEIELKPQSKPQILVNLKMKADILFIKGEYKIASEIYDSIIRINQDSNSLFLSEIYRDKGVTLSIINQADSAIKYLLTSLNIAKTFN